MRRCGLALLILLLCSQISSAFSEVQEPMKSLQMQDYFVIFIAAVIYINIFLVVLYRIFKRTEEKKSSFVVINIIGTIIAFAFISAGYIQVIFSSLVIVAITTNMPMFVWAYYFLIYYFSSVTTGLVIVGASGLASLLIGIYILIMLRGNPFIDPSGMPGKSGTVHALELGGNGEEPTNPNITFRAVLKESDEPAIDVKLILQQRDGSKIYEKYTDFNGEVTFQKIAGYASDYYAFVEGDEGRSRYRVIRSRVSSASDS
jgi:hypothetical protein